MKKETDRAYWLPVDATRDAPEDWVSDADISAERPNQVWASDITYLPMAHGFLYLVAILDVASRKVLAFRLSNTLTADFWVEALEEAISKFGKPEILNTDLTLAATEQAILEAIEFRLDGLREDGIPIRDPSSTR